MTVLARAARLFDRRPLAAHLYVTERCNLDCAYCNEHDESRPDPARADLQQWLRKMRELGVVRLGLQGGEPLLRRDIAEIVRSARRLGFSPVSLATNGLLLTPALAGDLEQAGLGSLHVSIDRMTPSPATRKTWRAFAPKLAWLSRSRLAVCVSAVLAEETADEMRELIDTCLSAGLCVQARLAHDDLVQGRALLSRCSSAPLLELLEYQRGLKREGRRIRTTWSLLDYQIRSLAGQDPEWTCLAGYKYFFVSAEGLFWPCSQLRGERQLASLHASDLRRYQAKKPCQRGCGVHCVVDTSLAVNHPVRYSWNELLGGR